MTETITATQALQKIKSTMEASIKMVQARTVGALMRDKKGSQFLLTHDGSTERIATMSVSPTAKDCREAHYSISGFWDEACLANS